MNFPLIATTLLAQLSRWERMGDGLHRSHGRVGLSDLIPYIVGLAVVGVGIAVVVKLVRDNDLTQPCDDPQKLFRELSRAHGLDRVSQRLLRELAAAFGMAQPAEVFLTPSVFEPQQLPEQLREEASRFQELRQRLFD